MWRCDLTKDDATKEFLKFVTGKDGAEAVLYFTRSLIRTQTKFWNFKVLTELGKYIICRSQLL